jgi:stalled ribosome rescue protein Dom34
MESRDRNRRREELNRYYDRIIKELPDQANLLIMGPGKAKEELISRIGKSGATRSLQSETAPQLSEGQIAERVRRFATDLKGCPRRIQKAKRSSSSEKSNETPGWI